MVLQVDGLAAALTTRAMAKPKLDKSMQLVFGGDALSRSDEGDDALFYARDRFVNHLDARALTTVETLIRTLVVEDRPEILDLMAGWDSHLPPDLDAGRVVGLGLNPRELKRNTGLTERVLHDVNKEPTLPFEDESFDVVLSTISVAYQVRPFELFAEVARVLRPGGLHLVTFSNRMFATKATKVWREASEDERVLIVEDYFKACDAFDKPKEFLSAGLARPPDDRYADQMQYSDPVYAIYAEKRGGDPARPARPEPTITLGTGPSREEVEARKARVRETLTCPYCEERMQPWETPDTPFSEWDVDLVYVCLNNACSYFLQGFEVMRAQGNIGFSYRLVYNPDRNSFSPAALPNPLTVRKSMLMPRG